MAAGQLRGASFVTNTFVTNFNASISIPDGNAQGTSSTINVSTPLRSILSMQVNLHVQGSFNGELYAYLVHGSGYSVLLNRPGRRTASSSGYGDAGLNVTFDDTATNGDVHIYRVKLFADPNHALGGELSGTWAPDGRTPDPTVVLDTDSRTRLLNGFQGLDPNGSWTLFVADMAAGNGQVLASWGLQITGTQPVSPRFSVQPLNWVAVVGTSHSFNATAEGTQPISYQWYAGASTLGGQTSATLALNNIQTNQAGAYFVVASNISGMATSTVATLTVRLPSDPVFATPDGGWSYFFNGDTAAVSLTAALDGTWNHNNSSDSWARDGRGLGVGMPGGIGTTNGILTIEDVVSAQTVTLDNRRYCLTHNLNTDPGVTNANLILNTGVTLSFRARLTPPPPVDPLTELTNAPNGWVNATDGKGMFGIRQSGNNGMLISFSLNRAVEDLTPTTTFNFGQQGLHMNNLNGDVRSANVDPGEGGTLNLLPLDPTVFHEFWVTIQDNGAASGTHKVSIYVDGNATPSVFNVTAGSGADGPFTNYLSLALPVTTQTGAYDIDYFGYKAGAVEPVIFNQPVGIVLQPVSQTLLEGQTANFTVGVTGTPPFSYQWYKNGTAILNATNASYTTAALTPSENGSVFNVAVSNNYNVAMNATPAVLTVIPDLTPPVLVSAGSLDGRTVGVCFSEAVTALSAGDATHYLVNGGAMTVTNVVWRTNNGGISASLFLSGQIPAGSNFTVTASGIKDISTAANIGGGTVTGVVQGFTAVDVGAQGIDPVVSGNTFICTSNNFESVAGGSGLGGTNDTFHFVSQQRAGDFDISVRVSDLPGIDRATSAGLVARESLASSARTLTLLASPTAVNALDGSGAGLNQIEANYRDLTNGPTTAWPVGSVKVGVPYPNAWLRLVRQGNFFAAYHGSNGVDWTELAELNGALAGTLYVGFATSSHTNSPSYPVTALYSDLQFAKPPVITAQPQSQTVTNGNPMSFAVGASGSGVLQYQWRFSGTNLPGATSANYFLSAAGPADAGSYDVIVSSAGGAVTSSVVVLTVRSFDFGDAPAPYPTLSANDGARHLLVPNFFLGTREDFEVDGQPDSAALGDDNQGTSDEDGVRFTGPLLAGQTMTAEVVASTNGYLQGWIDWNGNGDWTDSGEQIFANRALTAGTNLLSFTVFSGATANNTFARFRFSSAQNLSFTGPAPDGEVEDYAVSITHVADLSVTASTSSEPVAVGSNLIYVVTVQNLGPSTATSVVLTNILPLGVNLISTTPSQGACNMVAGAMVCSLGNLPSGGLATLTLVEMPNSAGTFTNLASVTASELDSLAANNFRQTVSTAEIFPSITTPPVSLVVTQGNQAVFHVLASGTGPLGYQWKLNGVDLPNKTLPDLTIASAQTNDAGSYTVLVSNHVGSVTSGAATLTLLVPPQITQQPQSTTNYAGATISLGVAAFGTAPLTYQWFFNGTNLMTGETNSSLSLLNAQKTNSGNYQVSLANAAGGLTSAVARVTILEADFGDAPEPGYPTTLANNGARHLLVPGIYLGTKVDFEPDGQPNSGASGDDGNGLADEDGVIFNGNLFAGQSASVTVVASTNGILNAWLDFNRNQSWADAGEQIFVNRALAAGTNTLSFAVPGAANRGTSFARFRFSSAGSLSFTGEAPDGEVEDYAVTLKPAADLAISVQSPLAVGTVNNAVIILGVTNRGPSAATGVVLTQSWNSVAAFVSSSPSQGSCTNSGNQVFCDFGNLASGSAASVFLRLHPTAPGTITNIVGVLGAETDMVLSNNSAQFQILAQDQPAILTQPQRTTVTNGDMLVLSVEVTGTALGFQWRLFGTNVPGQTGPILQITNVQPAQAGLYDVVVSNAVGKVFSAVVEAVVLVPPQIVTPPRSRMGVVGQTVVFTVTATGTDPLVYEWSLNGVVLQGETAALLTLNNVQTSASGTYRVRVSNAAGTVTSAAAELTVFIAPNIVQPPVNTVGIAKGQVVLSVVADGTEPLSYQWFLNATNPVAGGTNSSLIFTNAAKASSGDYQVVVTNIAGAVTSGVAHLVINELDFGDAQEATLLAFDGARHIVTAGVFLGSRVDFEADGQPNLDATGDDANGTADEDGVSIRTLLLPGEMALLNVVASTNGFLDAWIDFNGNGTWADGGEQIFTSRALLAGTNVISFQVPATAATGQAFARFRFSTAGGLDYYGQAADGEVEDYLVTILPTADVEARIVGLQPVVSPGSTLSYSLKVRNYGPATATQINLTNSVPATAIVSSNNPSQGSCQIIGGQLICQLGDLASGAEATVDLIVVPGPGAMANTATVAASQVDAHLANNVASAVSIVLRESFSTTNTTAVVAQDGSIADLYPSVIQVSGATAAVYKVTVTLQALSHSSPSDYDILLVGPQGQSVILMSDVGGSTFIGGVDLTFDDDSGLVLPDTGGFATETYRPTNRGAESDFFPAPAPPGPYGARLDVFRGKNPNGAWSLYVLDDTTNEFTGVISLGWSLSLKTLEPFADIVLSQTDLPDPAPAGSNVTYTLSASNAGPAAAVGMILTNTIPVGVNFISVTQSQGACANNNGQITCSLGGLEAGAVATVTILVQSTGAGTLTNRAGVRSDTLEFALGNNSSEATTLVKGVADLRLVGNSQTATVPFGSNLIYTLQVTNMGPHTATDVQITENLAGPANIISVTPNQGTCGQQGGTVLCNLGTVAAGGVAFVQIVAQPSQIGFLTNTAFVSASTFDFTSANNSISTVIPVIFKGSPFANTLATSIPVSGPAAAYPSQIQVSGLTGEIYRVSVTLSNLSHALPDDLDVLLVAPDGKSVLLMSDAGGATAVNGVTLTFSDDAALSLPDENGINAGLYKPSNYGPGTDSFAGPAPPGPYGATLDVLRGSDPNGTWSLFVMDDTIPNVGNLAGGWSLDIETLFAINDLRLSSSAAPSPAGTGSNVVYILTVTNSGPAPASSVILTNVMSSGGTIVSVQSSQGACSSAGGIVSCGLNTIPSRGSAQVTVVFSAGTAGSVTNQAVVVGLERDLIATNNFATGTVTVQDPPIILAGPQNITVTNGTQVVFTSQVSGEPPFNYQWLKDGVAVSGGNGGSLTIPAAELPNAGSYQLRVSNLVGAATSGTGVLIVLARPTISGIGPQVINEDTSSAVLGFLVQDAETPSSLLQVTLTSSDEALIPLSRIALGGTGSARSIQFLPATNANGAATLTLTVQDGDGLSASTSINVTVTGVNDLPVISSIGDLVLFGNTSSGAIPFTVSDVETAAGNLLVTATSTNSQLFPPGGLLLAGTGTNRTLTLVPATNQLGTSLVTVTVSDGVLTNNTAFRITVNNPLQISAVLNQTNAEDTAMGPVPFTVTHLALPGANLTVTATSSNQALFPESSLVLAGTGNNRTVSALPRTNGFGTSLVTLTVSDGSFNLSTAFLVIVTNVNDLPSISGLADIVLDQNTSSALIPFLVTDPETSAGNLIVQGHSSDVGLVSDANLIFGGTGSNRTLRIVPASNHAGSSTIQVLVNDGTGGISQTSFLLRVRPLAPVISIARTGAQSVQLGFATAVGADYSIEAKTNLAESTWTNLLTIPGDGTTRSYPDNTPAGTRRFYRVRVQ